MIAIRSLTAAAAALLTAGPALAFADRPPNGSEQQAIEKALRAAGFVSWEEIELDDDGPYWEIDDARTRDGKRYDVKLAPNTYRIVKRELDD